VVSPDGALACLVEPAQVLVIALPTLERIAEVGIDEGSQVALAGAPVRLAVLAPGGVLHVVDPLGAEGPERLAELELEASARILAASGAHLLLGSSGGPAMASLAERPVLARLPSRTSIAAAAAGPEPDEFLVVTAGVLEEWSATTRAPLRRFRLDQPVVARHLGASARHVWFVPEAMPARLVVLAVGGGRPHAIELPQPALHAAADRLGARAAIIGADTRAVFAIGLVDRAIQELHAGAVDDVGWCTGGVLCARDSALEIVELPPTTGRALPRAAAPMRTATSSANERLAAWKHRMAARARRTAVQQDAPAASHEWRDALARWARRVLAGGEIERPLIAAAPVHDVARRLGIPDEDAQVLWLVYAARLCGHDGVAPVDLVEVCPRRWDDALGRSHLAQTGAFQWRHSVVGLAPEIAAALDELPPLHGTAIASPIDAKQTVAVHAPTRSCPRWARGSHRGSARCWCRASAAWPSPTASCSKPAPAGSRHWCRGVGSRSPPSRPSWSSPSRRSRPASRSRWC
jgi:hypothetical protein